MLNYSTVYVQIVHNKYSVHNTHSISQYCRQELWCRFHYGFRLSIGPTSASISIHILWPRPFGEEKEKNYIGTPEWSPPNADRGLSLDRDRFSCINTLFVSIGTLISSIQKVHELVYRWQACGAWLEGPSDALNPNILTLSLNRISCIKSVFTFRKWTWLTKPSVLFDQRCPIHPPWSRNVRLVKNIKSLRNRRRILKYIYLFVEGRSWELEGKISSG